jgi:signal transduction histidine kinase
MIMLFSVKDNGVELLKSITIRIQHVTPKWAVNWSQLAIVKKVVDAYNGKIWIESLLGQDQPFHKANK